MSTTHNPQCPESQLEKKSNTIFYHVVREAVAMGELLTGHVKTDENLADLLTKVVGGEQKRKNLVQMYLYDIHDGWQLLPLLIGLSVLLVLLLLLNMA